MSALNPLMTELPPFRRARPDDAAEIARVHVQTWRETYAGLLPTQRIDQQSEADRTRQWRELLGPGRRAPAVFVAIPDGRIEGFVSLGPQRSGALKERGFDAEVSALYLTRAVQGRGLGRLLMSAAAHHLLDRGGRGLALWALSANRRAGGFYAALGGVRVAERSDRDGPQQAFGWGDPTILL